MVKKVFISILFLGGIIKLIAALPAYSVENGFETTTTIRATSTYKATTSPAEFVITATDLSRAGFTAIEELKPDQRGRFELPVQYFRVGENNASSSTEDCGDCTNLLAIYITPQFTTSSPLWILDQNPVVRKIGSRIQYKWFIGFRILYITSPRLEQAEKLAKNLRERIVLNQTEDFRANYK